MGFFKHLSKRIKHIWKTIIKGPYKTVRDEVQESYKETAKAIREIDLPLSDLEYPICCNKKKAENDVENGLERTLNALEKSHDRDHQKKRHAVEMRKEIAVNLIQHKGMIGSQLIDEASHIADWVEMGVKPQKEESPKKKGPSTKSSTSSSRKGSSTSSKKSSSSGSKGSSKGKGQ